MVVSGIGLTNLYHFTHGNRPCVPLDTDPPPDLPRVASENARDDACRYCIETMDLFVSAYGAEAGNLAVRTVATRGVLHWRRDRAEEYSDCWSGRHSSRPSSRRDR